MPVHVNKSMRTILLLMACILVGCETAEHAAAVRELDQRMSHEWLKANIITGKTTKAEIVHWFGQPFSKTSSSSSLLGFDEMWTYSVRFSRLEEKLFNGGVVYWTRAVVFNFKEDVVVNFTASSTGL